MTVDDVMGEIRARFLSSEEGARPRLVTGQSAESDIQRWSKATVLDEAQLLEALALRAARGFQAQELDFQFCDALVNDLWGFAVTKRMDVPGLLDRLVGGPFWQVFLAFDAGEFRPDASLKDPVERFTRPMMSTFLAGLDN